jgi:osmoprotectant transport system permease protein
MDSRIRDALALAPDYLGWHVALSAAALALGLIISLPLAVAAFRSPKVRVPALGLASLFQTIPSLALLALFYPLLLAVSTLSKSVFGVGFQALGFLPSLLALTIYSMLPILRTTIAGLAGVEPAAVEAARGVGMSDRQRLFQVELPLAAPVIMAGVRTSAVWTIGAATLATPVGQTSLGNYIFQGLQIENWVFVLFGCGLSAALALSADALLGLVESGTARRRQARVWIGLGGLLAGTLLAVSPLIGQALAAGAEGAKPAYVVGAKDFSEQYILADIMADRLTARGAAVTRRDDLGSSVAYRALAAGDIDVYIDYSGTLWANVLGHKDNPGRQAVMDGVTRELLQRDGVVVLGSLGFENAYALAMREDHARALGVTTIADLARVAPNLTIGGDMEFFARPEWTALVKAYGLTPKAKKSYQPTFMYRALSGGSVDVISAFSSDGRISADKLTLLGDPAHALPPYDAVILISPKRTHDARLREAMQPMIGAISVEAMQQANYLVDREQDKRTPAQAAAVLARRIPR